MKILGIFIVLFVLATSVVGGIIWNMGRAQMMEDANNPNIEDESLVTTPKFEESERQARFLIFTNGTKRIFTAPMYHQQWRDAYLEADDPSVVHVMREGVSWGEFFSTLPMTLNQACLVTGTKQTFCTNARESLKFYRNGEQVEDLLNTVIRDGDLVLITYGSENMAEIQRQLDQLLPL